MAFITQHNQGGGGSSSGVQVALGWQDFADLATQTVPVVQSNVNGGSIFLPTDSSGTLTDGNTTTNAAHTLPGVSDLWNSASNSLNFGGSGILANDVIDARVHFEISSAVVPQSFKLVFEFYDGLDGSGNKVFELVSEVPRVTDNAGTFFEITPERRFFVGESIKQGSCKFKLMGTSSFSVKMKGFNFEIRRPSK